MGVTSVTATVVEDPSNPGEFLLQFPEGFLEGLGWMEGDTVVWTEGQAGAWILNKRSVDSGD